MRAGAAFVPWSLDRLRRLHAWSRGQSVLSSRARRSVASAGFVAILGVAALGSCLSGNNSDTTPSASGSPSASPSPSVSAKPSPSPAVVPKKVDESKPPKGSVITRTTDGSVALTFDDGPQPTWTPRVLDQLKAAGIKATFCLIGRQVKANAALVRRMVAEGHTLCNHSWSHDLRLGHRTDVQIKADIERTDAAIHAVVPGVPIHYFRQPGGEWTAGEVKLVKELGKVPLGWAVDPWDWKNPGVAQIVSRVLGHTGHGSIVLMHDGGGDRSQTNAALRQILPALKAKYALRPLPPGTV
ncbi:MAG: polysaccharide deacetylase family protein [Hamadaea sp.]|nr:polysaccharide deacetylase family protein [Hamadaea sp.]NUT17616.1 polysaccharide deacetylase family protein [Hamadaea sp.]